MSIVFNAELKKRLEEGFLEDMSSDSPVFKENGLLWMKFDEIKQSNMDDGGGVKIEFFYRGKATHWMRVESMRFSGNDTLTLSGIEGKQRFTLA